MKKYYSNEEFFCELTENDVAEAEKEFFCYMQKSGKIYDMDTNKYPNIRNFFKFYFGECECDFYGVNWMTPNKYVCTNKAVADRFIKFAMQLDYHDRYNQHFCTVEQDGNIIDVFYGSY